MCICFKGGAVAAGRLCKDAEYKQVGSKNTDMTILNIITDTAYEGGDNKPKFLNLVAFGALARNVAKTMKGETIVAFGKISEHQYVGKDGTQKQSIQMKCDIILRQPEYNDLPPDKDKLLQSYGEAYSDKALDGQEPPMPELPF